MNSRKFIFGNLTILFAIVAMLYISGCGESVDGGKTDPALAEMVSDPPDPPAPEALEWPRVFQEGTLTLSVYQPQIDQWDGLRLQSRAAVAVKAGSASETFGIIQITATTDVDKVSGTVTLRNVQIIKASFPTAPDRASAYMELLRRHMPAVRVISLEHFEASYQISQRVQSVRKVDLRNDVPRIIFSSTPALLVLVDGSLALKPVQNSAAMYVANTTALILKLNDKFYATAMHRWYQADDIEGAWTLSSMPPAAVLSQAQAALLNAKHTFDPLEPAAAIAQHVMPPTLFVSTVPAELIQTQGSPSYRPVEGTALLEVSNTSNAIFLDIDNNQFYVLISGRWFTSASLVRGPWFYVSAHNLPGDFSRIPENDPRANVLVSVPTTPQAQEAVIATSIPQTAAVDRSQAKADVTYDGDPQFAPVQGKEEMDYAVNTDTPVIHVFGKGYYCVQNGVWFSSAAAQGPWIAADSIPVEIYSIPSSCPIYYATYVRVYDATPQVIYEGYTPGYLGAFVSPENVVVYGTGYSYVPYVGNYWVGYPFTYGYGVEFSDAFDTGFEFGFGIDYGIWPEPWWGPLGWGWRHGDYHRHYGLNHESIYDHWSNRGVVGHNFENRGVPRSRENFNSYYSGQRSNQGVRPSIPISPRSNVYAGQDGRVYRFDNGRWQRNTEQGWRSAERNQNFESQRSHLENEQRSRISGEQRFQADHGFGRSGHFASPGHFGGSSHGGGGGGRR